MNYNVLVPLDGSRDGESVFPLLRVLSEELTLQLTLLRCYEPPSAIYGLVELEELARFEEGPLREKLHAKLERQAEQLSGLEVTLEVASGHPAATIVGAAGAHDLVVMSSRGRGGFEGWLLGGVTTKVIRTSPKPVLVMAGKLPSKLETFLVCADGSEASERAVVWAVEFANAVGAKLVLYRFFPEAPTVEAFQAKKVQAESYLQGIADRHGDLVAQTVVRQTDGPGYIAELAEELHADLVFLGGQGQRGPVSRWLWGSVTEELVHHASCPVMVVP